MSRPSKFRLPLPVALSVLLHLGFVAAVPAYDIWAIMDEEGLDASRLIGISAIPEQRPEPEANYIELPPLPPEPTRSETTTRPAASTSATTPVPTNATTEVGESSLELPVEGSATPGEGTGDTPTEGATGPQVTDANPGFGPDGNPLDPSRVALAEAARASGGPRVPAPQAAEGVEDEGERMRGAVAETRRVLAAAAAARPHVTERPPPRVHRTPNAVFVSERPGGMRIFIEGCEVRIQRARRVQLGEMGGLDGSASGGVRFDITDAVHRRHGSDPHQAERRRIERSEAFQTALTEECERSRSRERRRMISRARARVAAVWRTEERSAEQRRRRIFRIWDQMNEDDDIGRGSRRAIISWIRLNLPAGGEDAFTASEIARFNARRESTAAFRPYG